jgi:hypothetical protein
MREASSLPSTASCLTIFADLLMVLALVVLEGDFVVHCLHRQV